MVSTLIIMVSGGTAYAAGNPPGGNITDPVVRAVDIARPSVVRIITTINSQISVHFTSSNTDVTFPQNTNINTTPGTNTGYQVQLSGTGTFISSQGDILTADHVVNPPHDQELNQALYSQAAQDIATYINQNAKAGSTQVTKDQVAQELASGQITSTPKYNTPSSTVFLSTDYTGQLTAPDFQSLPQQVYAQVDKIEKESPADQEDTAIVHVPMTDTPGVQLGDSSTVQVQDQLTIIGFPGNADVSQKPTDILTSSVNSISVSSIKTTNSGAPVIQVSGNVGHGDSGGPALDKNGSVVGIVSFGLVTSSTQLQGGTSFLQASSSAKTMIQALSLNTTPGQFQTLWNQAFTDYSSNAPGHWHKAQQEFSQLARNYPQFKAVTPYLNYAQSQALTEQVPSTPQVRPTPQPTRTSSQSSTTLLPNNISAVAMTAGLIAFVVILVALLFGVLFIQRKKKKQANAQPKAAPFPAARPAEPKADKTTLSGIAPITPLPPTAVPSNQSPSARAIPNPVPNMSQSTLTLKAWPCGHMNRPNARFCSICGEPAPEPPPRR